ncbi:MAG: GGDEF domain-containing protein [Rhodocyclaceae bacterium]|jgi:diguanylate cyclase (GGDEF)-like protein|nr:GGDEF domain-containing protein [Rhodocyclaceae bacterium]
MVSESDRKVLGQSKLFRHISIDAIEEVLAECPVHALASGDVLIEPEQENHAVFIVLEGELSVQLAGREAFEVTHLGPGECVGEISMVDGQRPSARVEAAGPARVLVLGHAAMWALLNRSHGVAFNLLWILSGRMRDHNKALEKSRTRSLEFEHAASVDVLTGLHNRRWLDETFARMLRRCHNDARPACLLMIDIDRFKQFNDTWGHLAGDAVLRHVSRQMGAHLRPTDLMARYGGEEFSALLPDATLDEALGIAERLRNGVEWSSLTLGESGETVRVTVSVGLAAARAEEPLEALIARADAALYRAKENGRNRVEPA